MSDLEIHNLVEHLKSHEDSLSHLNDDLEFFNQMRNRAVMGGNWEQVSSNDKLIRNVQELVNVTRNTIKELRNELGYEDNKASERPSTISW
jgi:flagellar biosynthesis chaperone FliJ